MPNKKRVYQIAKEFSIANEALIDFLTERGFKVRNHMAPVDDAMMGKITDHFKREETDTEKKSDFRKKLEEKRHEEEARREAVRHEIDEVLEMTKREVFEPVTPAKPTVVEKKVKEEKPERKSKIKKEAAVKPEKKAVDDDVRKIDDEADSRKPEIKKEKPESEKKPDKPSEVKPPVSGKAETDDAEKTDKPKRHLKRRPKKEKTEVIAEDGDLKSKKRLKKRDEADDGAVEDSAGKKKKKKRRRKKTPIVIDEKEIEASIRETMAKMDETSTKKKKKKKDRASDEDIVEDDGNYITTTEFATVAELANLMDISPSDVIKACFSLGLMVSINQRLDRDAILMVADEFDFDVDFQTEFGETSEEQIKEVITDDPAALQDRPPVVTIMGHVDHGKTSLLDFVRNSNIIRGESGGITQHIGAYEVMHKEKRIVFLDTPGHKAFTAMRARGAQVTDIVVLVVAADDDVMPQTIEAINHAKAAAVPIIVAINKMDLPAANPQHIKKRLADYDVLVEAWGGKIQSAEISAITGDGIAGLLDLVLLEAEILELKANPDTFAKGIIVEAKMDKGRGIIGTVLIQKGTLRIGEPFVAGTFSGRVRAMFDERNVKVDTALPSTPVQVLGFTGMPQAGDVLMVYESEQEAKDISTKRLRLKREQGFRQQKRLTLDQISRQIAEGSVKELAIIIKGDVDGSVEALADSLMDLSTDDVAVNILSKGVGDITESDVVLAQASSAVIIGFHVHPTTQAREMAHREHIDIRYYKVIYDVVNDVTLALSGLLEPDLSEEILGTAEVRQVFKASKVGLIAGSYVLTGKILRNSKARILRDSGIIYDGKIGTLKRFQDDVKEVAAGYECGITMDNFKEIQEGDVVEAYKIIETARTL